MAHAQANAPVDALLQAQNYESVMAALARVAKEEGSMDVTYDPRVDVHLNELMKSGKVSREEMKKIVDAINQPLSTWSEEQ